MIELGEQARGRLERYLAQVRSSLRGFPSVDPNEIERDVSEHIHQALQGAAEPVTLEAIEEVLQRLGSPRQWVPEEELAWWRKVTLRLRSGPEDWRLAYLSFGLLLAGLIVALIIWDGHKPLQSRTVLEPLGTSMPGGTGEVMRVRVAYDVDSSTSVAFAVFSMFLLASLCLSRAALSVAADRDELGAQKWLICPSLILVYVPLLLCLLVWPFPAFAELGDDVLWPRYRQMFEGVESAMRPSKGGFTACLGILCAGIWWILLGILARAKPRWPQALFRPFLDRLNNRPAKWLFRIGAATTLVCLAIAFVLTL